MISSWGDHFHQVSWGLDKNCRFFINGQFLKVSRFFASDFSLCFVSDLCPFSLLSHLCIYSKLSNKNCRLHHLWHSHDNDQGFSRRIRYCDHWAVFGHNKPFHSNPENFEWIEPQINFCDRIVIVLDVLYLMTYTSSQRFPFIAGGIIIWRAFTPCLRNFDKKFAILNMRIIWWRWP